MSLLTYHIVFLFFGPLERAPSLHQISNVKATLLADLILALDVKKKIVLVPEVNACSKIFKINCSGSKTFSDHTNPCRHRYFLETKKRRPHCDEFEGGFDSHGHLFTNCSGAAHLEIVSREF